MASGHCPLPLRPINTSLIQVSAPNSGQYVFTSTAECCGTHCLSADGLECCSVRKHHGVCLVLPCPPVHMPRCQTQTGRRLVLERLEKICHLGMSPPPCHRRGLSPIYPHSGPRPPIQPSRSKPESSLQPVMATAKTSSRRTAKRPTPKTQIASHEQGFDAPPGPLCCLLSPRYLSASQRHHGCGALEQR